MNPDQISYKTGIPDQYRSVALELYNEAFGEKLSVAVNKQEDRKKLFEKYFALEYAICAVSKNGLLGIAGLHTADGSLTGVFSTVIYCHSLALSKATGQRSYSVFTKERLNLKSW